MTKDLLEQRVDNIRELAGCVGNMPSKEIQAYFHRYFNADHTEPPASAEEPWLFRMHGSAREPILRGLPVGAAGATPEIAISKVEIALLEEVGKRIVLLQTAVKRIER